MESVFSMTRRRIVIDDELIDHLQWLARLKLDEGERARLKKELEALLDYFEQVVSVEAGGEELLYPNPSGRFRPDEPQPSGDPREHLANAVVEDGYVRAPKVVKG